MTAYQRRTLLQRYRDLRYRKGRIPTYPDLGPARGILIGACIGFAAYLTLALLVIAIKAL